MPSGGSKAKFDEPTAAECGTGKGTELSRRRRRLDRKRRALKAMRIWVPGPSQAGWRKGPQLFDLFFETLFSFRRRACACFGRITSVVLMSEWAENHETQDLSHVLLWRACIH